MLWGCLWYLVDVYLVRGNGYSVVGKLMVVEGGVIVWGGRLVESYG